MFEQLDQSPKDPLHVRARIYFVEYRKQFLGLALFVVIVWLELGLIDAPFGIGSRFDGVWLAERPNAGLPGSIKIRLRNDHLAETWPVFNGEYETIRLIVDGKQHECQESGSAPCGSYHVILHGSTLEIFKEARDGSFSLERWSVQDHGQRLIIRSASGDAVYRHASWLRSMIRNDP